MEYEIRVVNIGDAVEIARCFNVFSFLRTDLDQTEFVRRVQTQSREGYTIAYIESDAGIVAAAGFRLQHFLAWGKVLYLDDLITHPAKKKAGLATALMEWLADYGKQNDCAEMHLDTGYHRHDAHRMYLRNGLSLSCHHLSRKL